MLNNITVLLHQTAYLFPVARTKRASNEAIRKPAHLHTNRCSDSPVSLMRKLPVRHAFNRTPEIFIIPHTHPTRKKNKKKPKIKSVISSLNCYWHQTTDLISYNLD